MPNFRLSIYPNPIAYYSPIFLPLAKRVVRKKFKGKNFNPEKTIFMKVFVLSVLGHQVQSVPKPTTKNNFDENVFVEHFFYRFFGNTDNKNVFHEKNCSSLNFFFPDYIP
jgi:hypothetical protein